MALVLIVLIFGAGFYSGCVEQIADEDEDKTPPKIEITKEEAYDILVNDVINPNIIFIKTIE